MIVIGYQGIGKSTNASKYAGVVDLESSNFFIKGKRSKNWYIIYCQIAEALSSQGKMVFVSSHKEVREYLKENSKEKIVVCYPDLSLKNEWIDRLSKRYEETKSEKDYKALKNAEEHFDENIIDLMNEPFLQSPLYKTNYRLVNHITHTIQLTKKERNV